MKKVNSMLREYVENNGIKYTFISNKTGITARNIQLILNGKRYLRADEFLAICIVLNLDPNYFMEEIKNDK